MKTLSSKQYDRAYSYKKYRESKDYADLLSAIVDDVEQLEDVFYKDYKLDKRSRNINDNDSQRDFHSVARPLEASLDTFVRQFYSHLLTPDQEFMNEKYFNNKSNSIIDSPANSLRVKIDCLKKFIYLFRNRHSLELRRAYRFDDGRLYYTPSKHILFKSESFPKSLMTILFKDFTRVFDNDELINELISIPNLYLEKITKESDYEPYFKKIKKACEEINNRVSKTTGAKTKLIDHNSKTTSLNKFAFDQIDRIQFDKNR